MPYWGLTLIATTLAFFVPLVYTSNQEIIDHHLQNASDAINAQTAQVRSVAQKQADQISTIGKQYAGDYTNKVQGMLGGRTNGKSVDDPVDSTSLPSPPASDPINTKFPEVPAEPVVTGQQPMVAS